MPAIAMRDAAPMRLFRVHGWGRPSISGNSVAEGLVMENGAHAHRTMYFITAGEATVGDERSLFRPGDGVEIAVGESLDLRPLTKEVRLLSIVFADDEQWDPNRVTR